MQNQVYQLLSYWRNSIADASRMDIKKSRLRNDPIIVKTSEKSDNFLPENKKNKLFAQKKQLLKSSSKTSEQSTSQDKNRFQFTEINVIMSPFWLTPKSEHAEKKQDVESKWIHLMWIPCILAQNGELLPPEKSSPWIVRSVLEPLAASNHELPVLSTVDKVDKFMENNPVPREKWDDYLKYCRHFFAEISGKSWREEFSKSYNIHEKSRLIILDKEEDGKSQSLLWLYDHLRNRERLPLLLRRLCKIDSAPLKEVISQSPEIEEQRQTEEYPVISMKHLGQMTGDFALSASQRQALYYFLKSKDGDILAINGPPGTGKTTLLQSVVANMVVEKALKQESPPIILASSANNQAVTNIIESFGKTQNDQSDSLPNDKAALLCQRWLPEANSYALFLPSLGELQKQSSNKILYTDLHFKQGFPGKIKDECDLKKLKDFYLEQCAKYAQTTFNTLAGAIQFIHKELNELINALASGMKLWQELIRIEQDSLQYGTQEKLNEYIQQQQIKCDTLKESYNEVVSLQKQFLTENRNFPLWVQWFSTIDLPGNLPPWLRWFSYIVDQAKQNRASRYRLVFSKYVFSNEDLDFQNEIQLETFIAKRIQKLRNDLKQEEHNLRKAQTVKEDRNKAQENWNNWKNKYHYTEDPPLLYDALDRRLRYHAFYLATHYWEGRWLLEAPKYIPEEKQTKEKAKIKKQNRFRFWAMLTPCFVSTFFMSPKFFAYSVRNEAENSFYSKPLTEAADLLIVDEAGQVLPEVGSASFALAKKALVVGDTYQIEPIWNIFKKIDEGNIKESGLFSQNRPRDEKWEETFYQKGFSAARGNLMKLAQNASLYQIDGYSERGLMLREHRRCLKKIITYCNKLAYKGALIPSRIEPPENKLLFPPISYAHISGNSSPKGNSRYNVDEAGAIARWLKKNRALIENHYQEKLEDVVGIITPFSPQINELKRALTQAGINPSALKVGTIHALQGAERPVVIFSPVYGHNDIGKGYFFDKGKNMLNVAVSRAKDCFMVFGNISIFNPQQRSPSGLLASTLFADENNEITDIPLLQRPGAKAVEWIRTLERHRSVLKEIIEYAQEAVLISSPFISISAIKKDNLLSLFSNALKRGVKITVYTDANLDRCDNKLKPNAAKGRSALKNAGVDLIIAQGIHNKTLCMDNDVFLEGSFNWLSAVRDPNDKWSRQEGSLKYEGEFVKQYIDKFRVIMDALSRK